MTDLQTGWRARRVRPADWGRESSRQRLETRSSSTVSAAERSVPVTSSSPGALFANKSIKCIISLHCGEEVRSRPLANENISYQAVSLNVNSLIVTLKPQSNGPLYINTGRWWARCYIWYSVLSVPNVTTHPSTASVPTSYYSTWHYNCFWTLKG